MLNSKKFELDQLIDAVGNGEDLQRMLTILIESTPNTLRELNNSYSENNLSGIADNAHKLKATIDMLKITELKDIIRKIDTLASVVENRQDLPNLVNKTNNVMNQILAEIQLTYFPEK